MIPQRPRRANSGQTITPSAVNTLTNPECIKLITSFVVFLHYYPVKFTSLFTHATSLLRHCLILLLSCLLYGAPFSSTGYPTVFTPFYAERQLNLLVYAICRRTFLSYANYKKNILILRHLREEHCNEAAINLASLYLVLLCV